jgi:hypothetical protein
MLSLAIHHNVYLTNEQRYALHRGEEVTTVGVSVPVWYANGVTSEPAREVFCNYVLKNPRQEIPVRILDEGYEIALPYREGTKLAISNEEWKQLLRENPTKLESLYSELVEEVSSKNLLDIRDGGSEHLSYRELNKIQRGEQVLRVMHFISIDRIEKLSQITD